MHGAACLKRLVVSALIAPQSAEYVSVKSTTAMDANLEP